MYGNLLYKYPVIDGSVWEFEQGRLVCGSNLNFANQEEIPQVDCVFTDPPWNQGNMKMFYKFARKESAALPFSEFILGIFDLLKRKTKGISTIYFDAGVKEISFLLDAIKDKGFKQQAVFTTSYGKPVRPCMTAVGSFYFNNCRPTNLNGLHGVAVIKQVISDLVVECPTLFDPCCGKLDFLVEGLAQGMTEVYGIELIPEKLALGLQRLEKLGYHVKRVK